MKRDMTLRTINEIILQHKDELREKYDIKEIGIFGSFVRGEENSKSDIDILIEFNELPDIYILIDLEDFLKNLLKYKVDVVRKAAIRHELREEILEEVVYI